MKRTRCLFAISACIGLMVGPADAEFIGLDLGAKHWPHSIGSYANGSDSGSIDLVDDLDVEDPSQNSMVLILEHPFKALPNLKYRGYSLDTTGTSVLDSDINLNGQSFSSSQEYSSRLDLSQDEIVLYYQLVNNRLDLDLGVDLRRFDGEIALSDAESTRVDVDETIPLLHLSARYAVPNSGFYFGADINANLIDLGISDSSTRDSTIMMGYESRSGIGLEGGFKYFSLDLDESNELETDLEYDGIYLNGYFNF